MSDEEWKEDEVLTLSQKIKKLFSPDRVRKVKKTLSPPPLKQTSTKKIKKLKHRKKSDAENLADVLTTVIETNRETKEGSSPQVSEVPVIMETPELLSTEHPSPEQPREKSDKWVDEDKPVKKRFIPQLDKQLPLPLVIKRILAALIVLTIVIGVIFVVHEPTPVALLLIIGFLLLDYLSITGPQKEEKWDD